MYSFRSRVRYSELSPDKKLSMVSIINYFQDCCTFESQDTGVGLTWLAQHHTAWKLTNWQIHVIKYPNFGEEIEIITWACGFKYFLGKRSFLIKSLGGDVLVYALSDWAYVNVDKNLPEKNVPQKELDAYGLDTPLEQRFSQFRIDESESEKILKGKTNISFMKEERPEVKKFRAITVSPEHLDTNNHVNNAQYAAIASSVIPEDFKTDIFRAEYKLQSRLGDKLYPIRFEKENGYTVVLSDEEDNVKLICEYLQN